MNHWDDYDPYDEYAEPGDGITCNRCHAEGLEWLKLFGKWVLMEPGGGRHRCTAFNETVNDFEVLK